MGCASRTPCQDAGPIRWPKKFDGDKLCYQKQSTEGSWLNQGEFTWFHKNGKPALRGHYVEGKADGVWSEYDDTGEKILEKYFENGVEKSFVDPSRLAVKRSEVSLSRQDDPASGRDVQTSGPSKKPGSAKDQGTQAGPMPGKGDSHSQASAQVTGEHASPEGRPAVATQGEEEGQAEANRMSSSGTRSQADPGSESGKKSPSGRGE